MHTRAAVPEDAAAIAGIYNQGIEDRVATFETRRRSEADVRAWFDGAHPIMVAEQAGEIVAFAVSSSYRPRECYAGIAECSVYVVRAARGRGAGRLVLSALIEAASRRLCRSLGFREVGLYEKHARLDGVWRDVVIVERLLP